MIAISPIYGIDVGIEYYGPDPDNDPDIDNILVLNLFFVRIAFVKFTEEYDGEG